MAVAYFTAHFTTVKKCQEKKAKVYICKRGKTNLKMKILQKRWAQSMQKWIGHMYK